MGILGLCACVCLSVLVVLTSAQPNEVLRPFVPAPVPPDDEMAFIIAECNRRIAINDTIAHYVRVPSDCSAYASCEHPEIGVDPVMTYCPAGLFFNDDMDVNACVYPSQSGCPSSGDPCAGKPDGYNQDGVRTQSIQGAWYECVGGRAVAGGWCELGEQFLTLTQRCRAIPDLPPQPPIVRTEVECHLSAVAENPAVYMSAGHTMSCPPGTSRFDQATCLCVV